MRPRRGRTPSWSRAIGLAAAIAALSVPLGDSAAANRPDEVVFSTFELEGSHGYEIEGGALQEADFPAKAFLAAHRNRTRAQYEVPAELRPGLHARFGSLGGYSLRFQRRKRTVDRPEKRCVWIEETGIFRGQISFTGEGGYTTLAATSVPGEVIRLPYGFCGFGDDRRNPAPPEFPYSVAVGAGSRIPGGTVGFEASRLGGMSRIDFSAEVRETIGAVKITRTAFATGAAKTFSLGGGERLRHARVEPPAPFRGSADFHRGGDSSPTWTGSLAVSLPGAPDTLLAGPGFGAKLCPRVGILGRCRVGRSAPPGQLR